MHLPRDLPVTLDIFIMVLFVFSKEIKGIA